MNEENDTPNAPQLARQEPLVDKDSPWGDDTLGSKKIANTLTKLVAGQKGPLVLSVNGGWGTGKTFMLKRWQQDLENNGYAALYYSAWEDDFSDEPLVSIAGQLAKRLDPKKGVWKSRLPQGGDVADFFEFVAKTAINVGSSGFVDGHKLIETMKALPKKERDYSALYRNLIADRDELREKLKTLADKLGGDKPLIFIVDELDRCRPTYAISLLERIKHIFNVSNIIFVLGMNKEQLGASIRSVYGKINKEEYLQRLVDYNLRMPTLSAEQYAHTFPSFHGYNEFLWVCENFGLSLREVEHCHRVVWTVRSILGEKAIRHDIESIFSLAILRMKNPELYENFKKNKESEKEMLGYFHEQLEPVYADINQHGKLYKIESSLYFLNAELTELLLKVGRSDNDSAKAYLSKFCPTTLPQDEYNKWILEMGDTASLHYSHSDYVRELTDNKKKEICKLFDLFPAEDNQ